MESYSADLIHGVSIGQVLTAKHYLLGSGLHSLTGQKKVVQLTSWLGNCMTYDKVLDIETVQAQKAQYSISIYFSNNKSPLGALHVRFVTTKERITITYNKNILQ